MKIGLFYGSTTCYTEMVAEKIRDLIGEQIVDLYNVKHSSLSLVNNYDFLIFGISTWDFGELQEDWEAIWQDVTGVPLENKHVALYGLGDQEGYGEWFLDAMGLLHEKVKANGAHLLGYWPVQGYQFSDSKALTPDKAHFVGLALDEDSQYELTDQRLEAWITQVLIEYSEFDETQ